MPPEVGLMWSKPDPVKRYAVTIDYRTEAYKKKERGREVYSTYTGQVRGVRDEDNVYLSNVHSPTARRAHVFAPAPTPRAERAIVSIQGVAFAYMIASGGRRDLPGAC